MPISERTSDVPDLEIKGRKITLSWRILGILLGILATGGVSFGAIRLATMDDVKAAEKRVENKLEAEKTFRASEFKKFELRVDAQEEVTIELKETVDAVQNVQHWQAADQAAERVSQELPKHKRNAAYKFLFKRNMERLKAREPKMPCTSLVCAD